MTTTMSSLTLGDFMPQALHLRHTQYQRQATVYYMQQASPDSAFVASPLAEGQESPNHTDTSSLPRMCSRWLSGCYNHARCPCVHSLRALIAPFYTPERITLYTQRLAISISTECMEAILRSLELVACVNTDCANAGSDRMTRKYYRLTTTSGPKPGRPYCLVQCRDCKAEQCIEIYHEEEEEEAASRLAATEPPVL